MKRNKKLLLILAIAMIAIVGLIYNSKTKVEASILPKTFTDLIGTRVASTTSYVSWYGNFTASTTYPIPLLGASDAMVFFSTQASSSANMAITLLGSNDPQCSTATTSTTYNDTMLKKDIKWFDAGNYLYNASVTSSFSNSTTTIGWLNPSNNQRALRFTGLNMECLAVEVSASSTSVYAGYKLK